MVVTNGVNDSVICTIMNNISFFIMFAILPSEYFLYLSSIKKLILFVYRMKFIQLSPMIHMGDWLV
ncbi:Uncharacterised protein [Bacteroides intestinalis]|uniref:Uncharacterized protein n=1 Tax=Bacteroides intestinalis TaxID=329854 RepID=A0A6N2VWF6_9BACE